MSAYRSNVRPIILGIVLILAVFGVGLLIVGISPTPVTTSNESIVATGDWPPYIVENAGSQADGREHGPLAAFVTEMFRLAGYKINLKFYKWEDALDAVESGEAIAAFPYAPEADIPSPNRQKENENNGEKKKRTDRFWFTESFFPFPHVLYYKRDRIRVADLARWVETANPKKRYRLGRVEGYALWPKIVHSVKEISGPYADIKKAFEALNDGKIDLLPESPHVGSMLLRARAPGLRSQVNEFGRYWSPEGVMAGSTLTLHVLTARTRTGLQLRNQLNAAIVTLVRQGRLAELKSTFFEEDDPQRKRTPGKVRVMTVAKELCESSPDCSRYVLAQGTSAVVLIWPPLLKEPSTSDSLPSDAGNRECLVKIKDGPHVNRLMYVPISALELNPQDH